LKWHDGAGPAVIQEREIDELQLLSSSCEFRGVKLTTRIIPALGGAQSGDWCETFPVSDDVIALSIGDVCGHGQAAFEPMLLARQAIRDAAGLDISPVQTLAEVNRYLCREQSDVYVTAIFGLLDTNQQTFTFANAGHPPLLMAGLYEGHVLEFGEADLPLGFDPNTLQVLHTVKVPPEILLVLYTDGVIEHELDAIRGQQQLCEAAVFAYRCTGLSAAPVIERQMLLTGSNFDDAAILAARMPARAARGVR
jgi:serine phosphatase RsbU (regulator of sigma subunit)